MNSINRVLVLEDEPLVNDLIKMYCKFLPFPVDIHGFLTPMEALADLEQVIPDLMIVDILLPEMNAYQFLKHAKERCQGGLPPTLLITAIANDHLIQEIQEDFPVALLRKPFRKQVFLDKLQELIKPQTLEVPRPEENASERVYKATKKA
jgi:CheY-like chemotaxis protein